jgi:hypothetical protein
MQRYDAYRYLWPPRPELVVPRAAFARYADWGVQIKKNGTCNTLAYRAGQPIIAMNRHREQHKLWQPSEATHRAFYRLPGTGWYYVIAELLHSKVPGMRDINYIFDILVCNSHYLTGMTFAERQEILFDLFKPKAKSKTHSHYVIDEHTWLAVNHRGTDFLKLFDSLTAPDDEGIVFKNPQAPLISCAWATANKGWQAKSRRGTKTHLE